MSSTSTPQPCTSSSPSPAPLHIPSDITTTKDYVQLDAAELPSSSSSSRGGVTVSIESPQEEETKTARPVYSSLSPWPSYVCPSGSGCSSDKKHALSEWGNVATELKGKTLAIFLDYDGTLTPIVSNPDDAIISDSARQVVSRLGQRYRTAIVTGRRMETITKFMGLDDLYYAGSHGFDVRGPSNVSLKRVADPYLPYLAQFKERVSRRVRVFPGCLVEDNLFAISVHYRNVKEESVPEIERIVDEELSSLTDKLRKGHGKKVFEVKPKLDWNKGKAVECLMSAMFPDPSEREKVVPVYLGDDITDEDAFLYLSSCPNALTVFVRPPEGDRPTAAKLVLNSCHEVIELLQQLQELAL